MTVQLAPSSQRFGASAETLQRALNASPAAVVFTDPKPWGDEGFSALHIHTSSAFACRIANDHAGKARFVTVRRGWDRTFTVEAA